MPVAGNIPKSGLASQQNEPKRPSNLYRDFRRCWKDAIERELYTMAEGLTVGSRGERIFGRAIMPLKVVVDEVDLRPPSPCPKL